MQIICTSLQTDNHASTWLSVWSEVQMICKQILQIFTGWMLFLTSNQQRQSTEGNVHHITTCSLK